MIPRTEAELKAYNARLAKLKAASTVRTHRLSNEEEVLGFGHARDGQSASLQPRQGANLRLPPSLQKPAEAVFLLPYPPSVNHCWARNKNGGMRLTDAGKEFRLSVQLVVNRAGAPKLSGRLSVEIIASPPDKRRRDLDNTLKATLDALQHAGLYADDEQIDDLRICRAAPKKPGSLLVRVRNT